MITLTAPSRVNRREQILTEASRLFSKKGYQATGMRELATAVGIEPASLYSHFPSKDHLLWEIASVCAEEFLLAADRVHAKNLSPIEQLSALIEAHVLIVVRNQPAAAVFDTEWVHLSEERRSQYARMRDTYEQRFRGVIQAGIAAGQFRATDAKFAALTVLSALNFIYKWYRPQGAMSPETIATELNDLLLQGLAQPAI